MPAQARARLRTGLFAGVVLNSLTLALRNEEIERKTMKPQRAGAPFGQGGVMVFLRRSRPGRVTLDFVLPESNGHGIRGLQAEQTRGPRDSRSHLKLMDFKKLSVLFDALLAAADRGGPARRPIVSGDLRICGESCLVKFKGRVIDNLTRREMDLFSFLVASGPKIISRQGIISEVWKTSAVENLVDTHIFNLRRKLPPELAARLQSVPGKGFRYSSNRPQKPHLSGLRDCAAVLAV